MCNLYALTHSRTAVIRWFGVSDNRTVQFEPLASIIPGHEAPVLRAASDGALELSLMHWGFVLPQTGRAPKRVTNVRDDRIQTSRFWTDSFEERRCLVPASSYLSVIDDNGQPVQLSPSGEWTIYPYLCAAEDFDT